MRHFIPTFIIILLLASCVNSPVNLLGKVSSTKLFTTNGLFSQQHNTYRVPDADLAALS